MRKIFFFREKKSINKLKCMHFSKVQKQYCINDVKKKMNIVVVNIPEYLITVLAWIVNF